MNRNQTNFTIAAVCVLALLALGLGFYHVSSQNQALDKPTVTQAASAPETMVLNSNASAPDANNGSGNSSKISQLFQRDMLGSSQQSIEAITGPATNVAFGSHEYLIDGCAVSVVYDANKAQQLGMVLVPNCQFSLASFGSNTNASDTLTYGQLRDSLPRGALQNFQAGCLSHCGNAEDPTVSAIYQLDEGDSSMEIAPLLIQLETVQVDGPALTAAAKWAETMQAQEGAEWVDNGEFNCDGRYNELAQGLFDSVPVHSITIGRDIIGESCTSAAG